MLQSCKKENLKRRKTKVTVDKLLEMAGWIK